MCVLTHVQLFVISWTVAHQAPLSKGFLKQECDAISFSRGSSQPRERTHSPASPELADGFFTTVPPGKPRLIKGSSIKKKKRNHQWDFLGASTAGREQVQSQVRELGSHMLHGTTQNTTKQNHREKKNNLFSFFCRHWILVASCRLLSLVVAYKLSCLAACGILVPWPGVILSCLGQHNMMLGIAPQWMFRKVSLLYSLPHDNIQELQ